MGLDHCWLVDGVLGYLVDNIKTDGVYHCWLVDGMVLGYLSMETDGVYNC